MELTTYYPAPYGDYKDISTWTLKIGNGNTSTPQDGVINFKGLALGKNTDPSNPNDGDLYYNTQTDGSHKFRHFDGTNWKDLGDGGGGLLKYKGATLTNYHGNLGNNQNNGYARADAICRADVSEAQRVCNAADFATGLPTDSGWFNTFVSYYSARGADCGGWTSEYNDDFGSVWNATQNRATGEHCGTVPEGSATPRPLLCCG